MKKVRTKSDFALLRQKAEELMKKKSKTTDYPYTESEILKIIQELEIYQIELDLQNEQLIRAKTEAQIAADKYRKLFDFAPTGYFTLSSDSKIIELNMAGANMLGKKPLELKDRPFESFITNDRKQVFHHFLRRVFKSYMQETCEVQLLSDSEIPIWVNLSLAATEDGKYCLMNAIDISFLKLTERELTQAKEKAQESERLKTAFLSNMSHEIRTPMNGILGFTELLKEPLLKAEDQQEYLEVIERSGGRMLKIVNDIINYSKVEAGQMEISISVTNINDKIKFIYNFFSPETLKKGIGFSANKGLSDDETFVLTDPDKIIAILTNLVKNAIKFTAKGTIEFGYKQKGNFLEFYVKDSGIGIHHDQLDFIFERFRKAEGSQHLNFEGSGLGLAISKAYVGLLGGKIWVESQPGSGSVFYFTIPYKPGLSSKTDRNNKLPDEKRNIPLNKFNILIAEDDKFSAMYLSKAVEKFSKGIHKARTGVEAVEICRKNPDIDLVLMDVRMPEMDGYEATREIRKFHENVIIIAQTACGLIDDQKKSIDAGFDDYISKPFSQVSLRNLIMKHINGKSGLLPDVRKKIRK